MSIYQHFVTILQQGRRPIIEYRRKCDPEMESDALF